MDEKEPYTLQAVGSFGTLTGIDPKSGQNTFFLASEFHFHEPSEHTINKESFAMELHFDFKIDSSLCNFTSHSMATLAVLVKLDPNPTSTIKTSFFDSWTSATNGTNFDQFSLQ